MRIPARRQWLPILALALLLSLTPSSSGLAQSDERCFTETGQCISGRIREFWERNGGLTVFGFPVAPLQQETIEGRPIQAQWFERNRLELHPENQRPYDVLIGRLGDDRLRQQGRDWHTFPATAAQPGCRVVAETGHNICGEILALWQSQGLDLDGRRGVTDSESLALFGLPLSDLQGETLPDGTVVQAQWFERARFELHPENQPPYRVLLGLLGNEIRAGAAPAAPPVAAPPVSDCPALPVGYNSTVTNSCLRGGDLFQMVGQGLRASELVRFTTRNAAGQEIPLTIFAGDAAARSDGSYVLKAALPAGIPAGLYEVRIHGRKSGAEAVAWVAIAAGAPSGIDHSVVPAPTNGSISPETGRRGYVFRLQARNLPPFNAIGVYITFVDDGAVSGAPFTVSTEKSGDLKYTVLLETDETDRYGLYVVTFEALATGDKAYAYLRIVPEE